MGPRKEELVCTSRSQNRCIQQPGARWDESTKVYEMSSHPARVGAVGAFILKNNATPIVVVDFNGILLRDRVAKSMEGSVAFSAGCWHAGRLGHRARRIMGDSEAMAESWIGTLGWLWDSKQGLSLPDIGRRLSMHACGFSGAAMNDSVVDEVQNLFVKANTLRGERANRLLRVRGLTTNDVVQQRLRSELKLTVGQSVLEALEEDVGKVWNHDPATIKSWNKEKQLTDKAATKHLHALIPKHLELKKKEYRTPLNIKMGLRERKRYKHLGPADFKRRAHLHAVASRKRKAGGLL